MSFIHLSLLPPPSLSQLVLPLNLSFHLSELLFYKHRLHPAPPISLSPSPFFPPLLSHTPSLLSPPIFLLTTERVCVECECVYVCTVGWRRQWDVKQSALVSRGSATERSQRRIKRMHWRAHFSTASSYNALAFPSVTHTHTPKCT